MSQKVIFSKFRVLWKRAIKFGPMFHILYTILTMDFNDSYKKQGNK